MIKVKYLGCTEKQARFGRSHDPRPHLTEGFEYVLERKEVHSWHTLYFLVGFADTPFNSVCFTEIENN